MLKSINLLPLIKVPHLLLSALLITQTACLTQFSGLQVDSDRFTETSLEVVNLDSAVQERASKTPKFYTGPMPIRYMLAFYSPKIKQEGSKVTAEFTIKNNLLYADIELSNIKAVLQQKGTNIATTVLKGSIAPGGQESVQVCFDQLKPQVNSTDHFDVLFYAKDPASAIAIVKQWSLSQEAFHRARTRKLRVMALAKKIGKTNTERKKTEKAIKDHAAKKESRYMGKISTQDQLIIDMGTHYSKQVKAEIKLPLKSTLLKIVDTRIIKKEEGYNLAITFKNKLASKFNTKGLAMTVRFPNKEFVTHDFLATRDNYIESKGTQEVCVPLTDKQKNITDPSKVKFAIEVYADNKEIAQRMLKDWYLANKSDLISKDYKVGEEYLKSPNLPKDALFVTNASSEVEKKLLIKGYIWHGQKKATRNQFSHFLFWRRKK